MCSLLVALFAMSGAASYGAETEPPRFGFGLGSVDLVTLAASLPPIESAAPAQSEPERPPTCRELHVRVEAFLANDVRARVASARRRLAWGERQSAVSTRENVSDSLSALVEVLAGFASYSMNPGVRDAKACLSFLDGYDARVRVFRDDVPETDATAPPGLLERWERIVAELGENTPCHRRR